MPKPIHKISDYNLSHLKSKLEEKLTFRIITKLDCKKASESIQLENDKSISESTIYRLFLLEGNKNTPYQHTLDILAQFIGQKDWFSFENYLTEITDFQNLYGVFPDQQQYKSLLSFNIHHGGLKPLYHFLEQFPTDISLDKKVILGKDIYKSLKNNPNNNVQFYKEFHTLPIIREGFFELLADPDFSIPDYEMGLSFYLNNIKPHHSIKALQDYIFANSLLLRYYFIKGKKANVLELGKALYLDLSLSEKDLGAVYVFPKMRYFCYRLFYDEATVGFNQNYFDWLLDFIFRELENTNLIETRIIIHTVCDTLQIYPKLQEEIFNQLVLKCPHIFTKFPNYIFQLPMKERLRFVDSNGATFFGAIK
jgi:hypothetical protein